MPTGYYDAFPRRICCAPPILRLPASGKVSAKLAICRPYSELQCASLDIHNLTQMLGLINITRRRVRSALLLGLFLSSFPMCMLTADARILSIAVPNFLGSSPDELEKGRRLAEALVSDLRVSGRFAPLDPDRYSRMIVEFDGRPQFADWRAIGVKYLVSGEIAIRSDGRIHVGFRLWDVMAGQLVAGMQYIVASDEFHRIPHVIADAIYERLTD